MYRSHYSIASTKLDLRLNKMVKRMCQKYNSSTLNCHVYRNRVLVIRETNNPAAWIVLDEASKEKNE